MKIINTSKIRPEDLKPYEREQVYNGLDCCITSEVLDVLLPQLDNLTSSTYAFSRSLQGPVLEMRLRGVRIDLRRKAEVVEEYFNKLDTLERNLERIVREGIGYYGFNWRSNDHLKELFYNRLGIPIIRKQGRPTVNRDALERMEAYLVARPLVRHLMTMRDLKKKIEVLKTDIDPDGRIRTSYNIAGTETGRFSSSLSEFGTGGNLQNIEDSLRSIFISDPGMKMAYLDAKSGESFVVGAIEWNLFKDARYLEACESGDPHTRAAMLCWPELPWTNDMAKNKDIAEQPFYRHHSYRNSCKKMGHATNYKGTPRTIYMLHKIPIDIVEEFQPKYFMAFPAHLRWHAYVDLKLRTDGVLVSLTGRRRHFFGRRDSDETLREAIAYDPQGSLADIVNNGMLNVWRANSCELLMQNHDAIIIQYPEELEDVVIPKVRKQLEYPVHLNHDRVLTIPYDCKTGWNWGEFNAKTNPDGLKSYQPSDKRKRSEEAGILDRPVRSIHR